MVYKVTVIVQKDDDWYVAKCLENSVASQGKTVEEAIANLKEALELYSVHMNIPIEGNLKLARVITLCGSTKFKKEFRESEAYLTLQGYIVLSLGFFEQYEGIQLTEEQISLFEKLHQGKIDMSDEIFVIDVGGYIGESTKSEIEYAKSKGKTIRFYSEIEMNTLPFTIEN